MSRVVSVSVKVEFARRLGFPEDPYLIRWLLGHDRIGSIRLHLWRGSDDLRYPHDHPWWFMTVILLGGYDEITPNYRTGASGSRRLSAFSVHFRRHDHRHCVSVPKGRRALTLLITGPKVHRFGFWLSERKFMRANKYFFRKGHHAPRPELGTRRTDQLQDGG